MFPEFQYPTVIYDKICNETRTIAKIIKFAFPVQQRTVLRSLNSVN